MKKIYLLVVLAMMTTTACGQREEGDVLRETETVVAEAKKEADAAAAEPAVQSSADAFAEAFQEAEATLKKAREMKYSWNTTKPLLKSATEAAEAGDYDKALKLVSEAQMQADLAIKQAEEQSTAWKQAVVQ